MTIRGQEGKKAGRQARILLRKIHSVYRLLFTVYYLLFAICFSLTSSVYSAETKSKPLPIGSVQNLTPIKLSQPVAKTAVTTKTTAVIKSTAVTAVTVPKPLPTEPQAIQFSDCNKIFKIDSQKLFYLTLASINANKFNIDEIQTKSGYILFTAAQKQFLATVVTIDAKTSLLKITPCNNTYYFPIGIVQNVFKYIDLNINLPIEKIG